MKKLILVVLAAIMVSCGVPLDPKGNLGGEKFVGKFHGIDVYRVVTPGGTELYIGVGSSSKIVFTQWTARSKYGHTDYPFITVEKP